MRIVIDKKRFSLVVGVGLLLIILIISCVVFLKNGKDKDENVNIKIEEKIKKEEMSKQDFLDEYTKISNKISEKLLDGTVYDNETLSLAVAKYNKILSSTNWSELRNCIF